MGLRYLQSVFHKGSYNFSDRQIKIVELQPVVILDGEMGFMEAALQDPCGLGGVGKRKTDMPAAFLLQSGKAFLFQQCAVVNDPNIVRQQGNFRKDMAGDQNGLPSCITELPDK